jgi:hypothetical protein
LGIKLTANISQTIEPDELKALRLIKEELSAFSVYQDGVKCLLNDDFSKIPTEASLKSVTASVSLICAGDYQQIKIDRTTPQVVRANFIVIWDSNWSSAVLEPGSTHIVIKTLSPIQRFLGFMKKGFIHFASGLDHIIFLLTVFVSVLLERRVFSKIYKYAIFELSLFTAGHASAACLSYGWTYALSPIIVEPLIALTIILSGAGLSNRFFLRRKYLSLLVFPFGMIHGLGFSNSMLEMGLTLKSDWLELVGFNIGLESAQILVIVLSLLILASNKVNLKYEMIEAKGSIVVVLFGIALLLSRI